MIAKLTKQIEVVKQLPIGSRSETNFFGDDALMGHTRSHSEHDG